MSKDKKIECVEKFLTFLYQIRKESNNKIKESQKKLKIDNLTDKITDDLEALLKIFR